MMGPCDGLTIEFIPVDRIKVLNPRERDRKKFLEIVDSIKKVGLKQPIKVTRVNGSAARPSTVWSAARAGLRRSSRWDRRRSRRSLTISRKKTAC